MGGTVGLRLEWDRQRQVFTRRSRLWPELETQCLQGPGRWSEWAKLCPMVSGAVAKHRCPACKKRLLQGPCDQAFHFF